MKYILSFFVGICLVAGAMALGIVLGLANSLMERRRDRRDEHEPR